jgi:hypothetical protein
VKFAESIFHNIGPPPVPGNAIVRISGLSQAPHGREPPEPDRRRGQAGFEPALRLLVRHDAQPDGTVASDSNVSSPSSKKAVTCNDRVTRLGEFWVIFYFGQFF